MEAGGRLVRLAAHASGEMVERARACYKRKLDEDPSYKCLTRLQVGWAVAGAYPLRTPPRFVPVMVVKGRRKLR